jgi:hypothetical protein
MAMNLNEALPQSEDVAVGHLLRHYLADYNFMYENDLAFAHMDDGVREFLARESLRYQFNLADGLNRLLAIDTDDASLANAFIRNSTFGAPYRKEHASLRAYFSHINEIVQPWVAGLRDYAPQIYMQLYVAPRVPHSVSYHIGFDDDKLAKIRTDLRPGNRGVSAFADLNSAERSIVAMWQRDRAFCEATTARLDPALPARQLYPMQHLTTDAVLGRFLQYDMVSDATDAVLVLMRDATSADGCRPFTAYPVRRATLPADCHRFSEQELTDLRWLFGSYFCQTWLLFTAFGWRQSVADYARYRTHAELRRVEALTRRVLAEVDPNIHGNFVEQILFCSFEPVLWFMDGDRDSEENRYLFDVDNTQWLTDVADYLARIVAEVPEGWQPERLPPFNNRVRANSGLPRYGSSNS